MRTQCAFRGLLSVVLAEALFLSVLPPAAAEGESAQTAVTEESTTATEIPEPSAVAETAASEETVFPEETVPPKTTEAAESPPPAGPETPAVSTIPQTAEVTMLPAGGEISVTTDSITLSCATEGAAICYAVSSDGENYSDFTPYTGAITLEKGFGILYLRAFAAKEGCLDSAGTVCVFTEAPDPGWNLYFGQLHAHSDLSDGTLGITEVFANAVNAGLDFLAVTDHSNSFDNDEAGSIGEDGTGLSPSWAAGKAAAAAVTGGDFVGIFGYEMTWQDRKRLGHISTFNTPGWQSRNQAEYADQPTALEAYYQALTTVPGSVSQFNHPGPAYGSFETFGHYSAAYDQVINLLEVGCEGGYGAYEYYIQALDAGWHVAPTNNHFTHNGSLGAGRTVILAKALTEDSLYDAMDSCRVYATGDSDLAICYELDGHIMGSLLHSAPSPGIRVSLSDPTDAAIGRVEVVVDGGAVAAAQTVSEPSAAVSFSVPGGYSYYFIRVTQPDGDIAVTAPVWVDRYDDMGISGFSADTALPVQGEEIGLTLQLYNNEAVDLTVNSIEFSMDGEVIHTVEAPGTVSARGSLVYTLPCTHSGMGAAAFRAVVTATAAGETRTYEQTLTLHFRAADMVANLQADDTGGDFGADSLRTLTAIAAKADISVTVCSDEIPEQGGLLIVSAPSVPFAEDFLAEAAAFVKDGGKLIVCGQSDAGDGSLHASAELNRLLAAVGSTLRINDDTAIDQVNNGGQPDALYSTVFNRESPWCANITSDQIYSQHAGSTVDPGSGTWLVKGLDSAQSADMDGDNLCGSGAVLLASEEIGGGTVFAAGSLFLSDAEMDAPETHWNPISVNQVIADNLLGTQRVIYPLSGIADARNGTPGEIYRVQGYVTAGTSNPYNTFPDTLYIQDDTGGIAVVPFTEAGIQVGTPMTVTGYLDVRQGNPVLELIRYEIPDGEFYRYVPKTVLHQTAMDCAASGGTLMQVEGEVVDVEYTADHEGVSRFTVKDKKGDLATVTIEDCIRSGVSGLNTLASEVKKGRVVRAMGILCLDGQEEPVLRVRDCDEVVYVPPVPIPPTGDTIRFSAGVMILSLAALVPLAIKKKKM